MHWNTRNASIIIILLISTLMHFKHFPKELMSIHVWRQTQTQSTIINFYEEDMNILNPRRNDRGKSDGIFRMEFPLMQWLVACIYKLFGPHLMLTRIFMFLIGFLSVIGFYKLLYSLSNNDTLSALGTWAFNFSPSFFYYTINPMPDNFALCCSIWGLALFFIWTKIRNASTLFVSGLLLSIGSLSKLPFIIYYIVPVTYFLLLLIEKGLSQKIILRITAVMSPAILPIIWYALVVPDWEGIVAIEGIFAGNVPMGEILDYVLFNLVSTFPELLLNYGSLPFFLAGFYFFIKKKAYQDSRFPLILMLSIILMLFYFYEINAIAKTHDYYLFPFYPLIFTLTAYGAFHLLSSKIKFFRISTIILILILPITCLLRLQDRWNPESPGFNKDLLIHKSELQNAVPEESLVVVGNDDSHYIFFYYIDKKGWAFHKDNLTSQQLKTMIEDGAEYLYSDSRIIEKEVSTFLDRLILEIGTIKIYSLKP